MRFSICRPSRRAAVLACAAALVLWGITGWPTAAAAAGPFADFSGSFRGTGTMHTGDQTERIRCTAAYRPLGSTQHEIDLRLVCASDSYKFDLSGRFQADEGNHVSGQWTEHSRNVGGIVVGNVRGNRFQLHVESSAFTADMVILSRGSQQSVNIDAQGGGQLIKAAITLHRN
jgi:hypothetical protein